jgi:hypothetical protein
MTACPHCGAQMAEGRSLCKACGKLSTATVDPNAPVSQVAPPPPKKGVNPLIVIILGALLVVCIVGGLGNLGRGRTPVRSAVSPTVRVDYVITGTASRASLTYVNATGNIEQRDGTIPWELRLDMPRGSFVSVSAQNQGASGSISCKIMVDLKVTEETNSSGAYKIASCSGRAQ